MCNEQDTDLTSIEFNRGACELFPTTDTVRRAQSATAAAAAASRSRQ